MTTAHTLRTLARFLIGDQQAIERIAASKAALWASLVFVGSAGLAREYDGEYLLAEPWHFLRPIGASLASGTVLFLLVHPWIRANINRDDHSVPFFTAYRRFMTCFWMTAPLAWLYAIPYERFMSPADAVRVNLLTLAVVAAWRVILITRVASVLYQANFAAMFFIVMLFADAVAFAVVMLVPSPVVDFMGGVQHTERDQILASTTLLIGVFTYFTGPLWILGALIAMAISRRSARVLPTSPLSHRCWTQVMTISIAIWIVPLLLAQPEQARRHAVTKLFENGDVPSALAELSRHPRADYPPRWEPPPRLGYGESTPDLSEIRAALDENGAADWVAAAYIKKIDRHTLEKAFPFTSDWLDALSQVNSWYAGDDGSRYLRAHADVTDLLNMKFLLKHTDHLNPAEAAALQTLTDRLERALAEPPANTDP